jgi:hypothetical protein
MTPRTATPAWRNSLLFGALALSALAAHPRPLLAQANTCALVSAGDAAALLGGPVTQKPSPGGLTCTWVGADGKRKVAVLTYRNRPGAPPEAMYMGARKGAEAAHGKVSDETGLGDRAFSAQVSFGAVIVAMKHGRVIQLQYWTGAPGSAKDVAALRPLAKKAVAAF